MISLVVRSPYSFSASSRDAAVIVYDGAGLLVEGRRVRFAQQKVTIDFSGLPNGIYYISVSGSGELRRVVVKN